MANDDHNLNRACYLGSNENLFSISDFNGGGGGFHKANIIVFNLGEIGGELAKTKV